MSDDGRPSISSWETADHPDLHPLPDAVPPFPSAAAPYVSRHPLAQIQPTSTESLQAPATPLKSPSPHRSSAELPGRPAIPRWRDANQAEVQDGATVTDTATLVDTSFDENVLRSLCDLDCGVPLLLDRIKQSMSSCREAAVFFKARARLEDEYARALHKLARASADAYAQSDARAGSYVAGWQQALKMHESMAENRLRFAAGLNEMSDELSALSKEVDKNRKQTRDLATRYERTLLDSETATEKAKVKMDSAAEELERVLLAKEGESDREGFQNRRTGGGGKRALGKAGMLLKGRNPGNIARQEDDVRNRMNATSEGYRKMVTETQAVRQEYFNFQLPRILRALKECVDEIDLGTQYHLSRYAFLYENIVLSDATTLTPAEDSTTPGLRAIIESIDSRSDFKMFMHNYAYAHGGQGKGPRRDGPREEGYLPPIPTPHTPQSALAEKLQPPPEKGRPTFGVDLAQQLARDEADVPPVLVKCCSAVERYGARAQGVYRVGGIVGKVQRLKEKLDRDLDAVDLNRDEWAGDISTVTSVLKLWLRELPDPLFTRALHQGFLDAARMDNERLRHIRLHERVNELPDANYATLKFLMGHLYRILPYQEYNQMSTGNFAIVFGPTLFGPALSIGTDGAPAMADASLQVKAVETVLEHYVDIFVDEHEDEATDAEGAEQDGEGEEGGGE